MKVLIEFSDPKFAIFRSVYNLDPLVYLAKIRTLSRYKLKPWDNHGGKSKKSKTGLLGTHFITCFFDQQSILLILVALQFLRIQKTSCLIRTDSTWTDFYLYSNYRVFWTKKVGRIRIRSSLMPWQKSKLKDRRCQGVFQTEPGNYFSQPITVFL